MSLKELIKIKVYLKGQPIIIYYDFPCSPLTYGDFSYVIFMCKFFADNFSNCVNLYLVYDNYEDKFFDLKKNNSFANELFDIAKNISKNNFSVKLIKSDNFLKSFNKNNNNYILLKNMVKKRLTINKICFNMLNIIGLFKKNNLPILKRNELDKYLPVNFGNLDYVTFSLRYNKHWGENRNITFPELENLINFLNRLKTNHIVLLSDEKGTEFYKSILESRITKNKLIFAKDFSKSFIQDLTILLNSNLHIQPKGSGLLGYLYFTETSYIVTAFLNFELNLGKNNLCSWASSEQVCCITRSFDTYIKKLNRYLIKNKFIDS